MLTQIEIDGFKTFKDFKVELAPFQVIVGPNGSGKSNLFDALHLLSRLMEDDIATAFQKLRGRDFEQFSALAEGKHTDKICMAVEMLVDHKVRDELGQEAELKYTRLRYEISITQGIDEYGLERLNIIYESLKSLPQKEDNWCKKYGLLPPNNWLPGNMDTNVSFIDTNATSTRTSIPMGVTITQPVISLFSDSDQDKQVIKKTFHAKEALRTVLSSITNIDYPHAFAAREELRSLRFLHLNPKALREPSPAKAPRSLSREGDNMPTTLARMQAEDKFALTDVSRDMANLVPGILEIKLEQDKLSDKYVIYAETSDQRSFSSQVLSDGTLRLLALATLRNDPQFHGILCLEEPENGVQPLLLRNMARVLREMATDFNDPQQVDEPLRQVLITTHSPSFISQPEVIDSLLLAIMPVQVQGKNAPSLRITRMVPVTSSNISGTGINGDKALEAYTIDMVRKFLDSDTLDEARNQLKKVRKTLNER